MTRLRKNKEYLEKEGQRNEKFRASDKTYKKFDQINGKHPFQKETQNSYILYKARKRKEGKVVVFNFDLAREIGLIPKDHPNKMNLFLEQAILDTFAIVIINEYDIKNEIQYPKEDILPNKFMATRYLQLQHPTKQGKTSGDGRSIWNGILKSGKKTWDISSCGTGATSLSPATHIQKKYFQTGDPSVSYGCGYSEVDEGLSTLFFSEILNKNNIRTERVLGVIKFPDGYGITIRVHDNLIRPSHMFNHLKQAQYEDLRQVVDYYINRQEANGSWVDVPKDSAKRYEYFLEKQTKVFSEMAAKFEDEYIFCWLDWDGDNILMDGGIIDYGSVRQFGLFHKEYRFDDDDRFSTSIIEQKAKARYTVQTFAQLVDFLKTKKKKPISRFVKGDWRKRFENHFYQSKLENVLYRIGFDQKDRVQILKNNKKLVINFLKVFTYFEHAKSLNGPKKVNDGITWDAIFCMRDILRELPQILLSRGEKLNYEDFILIIKSSYATAKDIKLSPYRKKQINLFQNIYLNLIEAASGKTGKSKHKVLLEVTMRSSVINKYDRVTGDSITTMTDMMMKDLNKMSPEHIYKLLNDFSEYQNLDPDSEKIVETSQWQKSKLMRGFLRIVRDYREGL